MKKVLIFCLFLATTFSIQAQTVVLKGTPGFRYIKSGVIESNDDVAGYYDLFRGDKVAKGTFGFKLNIYDQNVKLIKAVNFNRSRYDYLVQSDFNGELLVFKFLNYKEKIISYPCYNGAGKLVRTKTRPLDKIELRTVQAEISRSEGNYQSFDMVAIPGKGFIDYHVFDSKKIGYGLFFVGNDGKTWSYKSDASAKNFQSAAYFGHDDNNVYSIITKMPSRTSKKSELYVVAHSLKTGKIVFENRMENQAFDILPINSFVNAKTGNVVIINSTYKKGSGAKGTALGLEFKEYNTTGKEINSKTLLFAKDAAKFVTVSAKGKFDDLGYLYFHNVVPTSEGGYLMVAETYRKEVSALGAAGAVLGALGGGGSNVATFKIVTEDFVVITLDGNLDITGMDIIEKEKNNVLLPSGYGLVATGLLGHIIKQTGDFSFRFDQLFSDENLYAGFYYTKNKETKDEELGIIKIRDGKIENDKILLRARKDRDYKTRIVPAKKGYVMKRVAERSKKIWTVTYTYEKVDL